MLKVSLVFIGLVATALTELSYKEMGRDVRSQKVIGPSWYGTDNAVDFDYEFDDQTKKAFKQRKAESSRGVENDIKRDQLRQKRILQDLDLYGNTRLIGEINDDFHEDSYKEIDSRANQYCDQLKIFVLTNFSKYINLYRVLC